MVSQAFFEQKRGTRMVFTAKSSSHRNYSLRLPEISPDDVVRAKEISLNNPFLHICGVYERRGNINVLTNVVIGLQNVTF